MAMLGFLASHPLFAFAFVGVTHRNKWSQRSRQASSYHGNKFTKRICTSREMVRNIDLVEALVFYGRDSIFESLDPSVDDSGASSDGDGVQFLPGVEYLLGECKRDDTAVIWISDFLHQLYGEGRTELQDAIFDSVSQQEQEKRAASKAGVIVWTSQQPAPNPRDLWESLLSVTVQPKGFGGSSGFGSKAADPQRSPDPKHTVVLSSNVEQCRAARYVGTRVLCLSDNDLADGILDDDWSTICMDDIATPGSFWLNPPHPRDDESNKVDPETVMLDYESEGESARIETSNAVVTEDEMDDEAMRAILADMDPP